MAELWWESDPTIQARRREALEEIERAPARDAAPNDPDPVLLELLSGACVRELVASLNDLDRATVRYAAAVCAARAAGLSWAEIGRVLGVSKQALQRRFGSRV